MGNSNGQEGLGALESVRLKDLGPVFGSDLGVRTAEGTWKRAVLCAFRVISILDDPNTVLSDFGLPGSSFFRGKNIFWVFRRQVLETMWSGQFREHP